MTVVEQLQRLVTDAGPWLLPLLGAAALIEYVFPPFPGDTITLIGASLAVQGAVPAWAVFLACTVGSILGSIIDYLFGVWLQGRIEHPHGAARWKRWFPPERIERLEKQYLRWGPWLIVSNRFVPVSRALFFVFAGMSGLGLLRTVLLGTISAVAWNALLIGAGFAVGANLDKMEGFFRRINEGALVVCAVVVVIALGVWLWHRRSGAASKPPEKPADS